MTDGSVSCPAARQVLTHRGNLKKWQTGPRFKQMKAEHALIPGAVCAHCGRKHGEQRYDRQGNPKLTASGKPSLTSLTINHLYEYLYLDEDLYLTWDPATMEVCCSVCNGWYNKGKVVCPVCKCNPIRDGDLMCSACYLDAHPELRKVMEEKKAAREESHRLWKKGQAEKRRREKVKHPCTSHRIGGICGLSAIGSRCQYSRTKALMQCGQAIAKKGARA